MNPRLQQKIELSLLALFIILHITDFLEVLPGDLDFIKKLISWTALGYLFVKASLSTILLGYKKPRFDAAIILTYFLFITKNLVSYIKVSVEEAQIFEKLYSFVLTHSVVIEKYSFYLGAILLIFISLYMALRFGIRQPSFMAVLHEIGPPAQNMKEFSVRSISFLLVLVAFFITVFNLATEWLAIALDAPLVVIGILVYLFLVIRYHKKFHPSHFIYKIGHIGESFYENFIRLFHYKETLYLGVMGLLALHLLTDLGHFILPYLTGLKDVLYFGHLGPGHTPLLQLLREDISSTKLIGDISIILVYFLNAIAMIFLLVLPAFAWYRFFKGRPLHVSRTTLALVSSSLLCFALMPVFSIKKISIKGLAGVDIVTKSILSSPSITGILLSNRVTAIIIVAALALLSGIIIWLLEYSQTIEKDFFIILTLIGFLFFGFYIFYYFISLYQYYIDTIILLLRSSEWLIAFYFVLFAMMTILFYVGGYIFFLYEVFKRHFFVEEYA